MSRKKNPRPRSQGARLLTLANEAKRIKEERLKGALTSASEKLEESGLPEKISAVTATAGTTVSTAVTSAVAEAKDAAHAAVDTLNAAASAGETDDAPIGLRERNKADKRRRIMASASRLFAEHGYSQVTTSSIAKDAHVGNGTLFRYARSKADLLVAVMNNLVLEGMELGLATARKTGDPVAGILAILRPLRAESFRYPENMIEYQKEALFGDSTHQHMVTTRIADMETTILKILQTTETTPRTPSISQEDLARAIYATIYMDLVKAGVGHDDVKTLPERIPRTVENLIRAFCEKEQ